MKKVFLLSFVAILSISNIYAQKVNCDPIKTDQFISAVPNNDDDFGSFEILDRLDCINCSYSFDSARMKKFLVTEYCEEFDANHIDETVKEINSRFFEVVNDALSGNRYAPVLRNQEQEKYVLKLHVVSVDEDGEHDVYALLIDNETGEVVLQKEYNGNGGKYGTLVNLIGDAAERIAKEIAKDIDEEC